MALGMLASDEKQPVAGRRRSMVALVAAAVLMFLTSDAVKIFGPHASNWSRVANPVLIAGLAVMAAIFTARYSRQVEYEIDPQASADGPAREPTSDIKT
jgi:hypothetical protein